MARYQLFRTSPSLSGQVRLDIIVNKDPETQIISGEDIYVVPINDNIKFNESNKRNTLRYSHLDNIKNLYREIEGDFYNTDGEYTIKSWLYDGETRVDPYSHVYMAGPRRMRYTRYDKQFSYMIPVWISEYTDFSKLRFVCHAGSEDHDNIISSFKLSPDIIRYLQEYMDFSATGEPISDNLVNVSFGNVKSYIQGVQADTGQYVTRDTSYIMNFLLKRERPMIETDSNILDLFRQNNMIAQQILNLNMVFNIEDISGAWPEYYLYNKNLRIWIDVQYDGISLEYKDLYTNYEFIPRYNLRADMYTEDNVLDSLEDYNCIDTIDDNKFTQPIFHWSLVNNPNYIFNIYSGCAPSLGEGMNMDGGSFDWVDVSLDAADPWRQNWKWLKYANWTGVENWDTGYHDAIISGDYEYKFTRIVVNSGYMAIGSNIFLKFYDDADAYQWEDLWKRLSGKNIWLSLVLREDQDDRYDFSVSNEKEHDIALVISCKYINDMVLYKICHDRSEDGITSIYSTDVPDILKDLMSYIIGYVEESDDHKTSNKTLWDRWIRPDMIEFDNVLDIYKEDISFLGQKIKEFRYVESDDIRYDYMYRYSGNLQPLFVNVGDSIFYNNFYRYYQWDNKRSDIMRDCAELKNKNIAMIYPSIVLGEDHGDTVSYFPWVRSGDVMGSAFYEDMNTDIIWGRHNRLWNLPPTVTFDKIISKNMTPADIDTEIWKGFIQALYNMNSSQDCPLAAAIEAHETEFREFVNKIYGISLNFEYASLPVSKEHPEGNHDDVNNIIYTITYKLR